MGPGEIAAWWRRSHSGGTRRRFTVLIPYYNEEAFLERTLASWRAQTRPPERIVAVDNGSTDRSQQVCLTTGLIRSEAPDVLLLQEADRGMPESLGIDAAARISGETGYPHVVWGPKRSMYCGFRYVTGNAVLSKYPILEADNVALPPSTGSTPTASCSGCTPPSVSSST